MRRFDDDSHERRAYVAAMLRGEVKSDGGVSSPEREILRTGRCSECNCKNGWSDCNRITDRTSETYHLIRYRENQL